MDSALEQHSPKLSPNISNKYMCFVYSLALTVAVIAVVGNILVVVVILRGKPSSLKNKSTIFTFALAVFDFITGFIYAVWYIGWFEPSLKSEGKALQISIDFVHVKTQSSFLTVLAITIDRYMAIAHPMKYRSLVTKKTAALCCLGIWLYSATFSTAVNILVQEAEHSKQHTANSLHLASHTEVVVVLVVVIVLYYKMFKILQRKRRELDKDLNPASFRKQKSIKAEKRFMTTILIVISILVISVVPHTMYMTVKLAKDLCAWCLQDAVFMRFALLTEPVFLIAFAANPIIYAWRLDKYKAAFRSLLCHDAQVAPLMQTEMESTKT